MWPLIMNSFGMLYVYVYMILCVRVRVRMRMLSRYIGPVVEIWIILYGRWYLLYYKCVCVLSRYHRPVVEILINFSGKFMYTCLIYIRLNTPIVKDDLCQTLWNIKNI